MDSNEVKLHFLDYWRVIRVRWGLIALVFLLVMVSATVTVSFLPKEYFAKVSMEVRADDYKNYNPNGGQSPYYNAQFVATQFQILRKTQILYPVIQQLDLVTAFSEGGPRLTLQQVYSMLLSSLDILEMRNTSIIEVGVWNTDPERAKNIANTIANVYRDERLRTLNEGLTRSLQQYQDEVTKLQKKVLAANQQAAFLRLRDNVNDPEPESANSLITITGDSRVTDQAVNEARLEVGKLRTTLKTISNLKPNELLNSLQYLGITDATVQQNLPLLQQAVVEEAKMLTSGLGENHHRIRAVRKQKQALNGILAEALESIRKAQVDRLAYLEQNLVELETALVRATEENIKKRGQATEYIDAKLDYLAQKQYMMTAEQQLLKARMEAQIDVDPVIIRQKAERPEGHSRPVIAKYLVLAALIGLIVGVALAFFIEYLDTSVKTLDDLEKFLQLPVLAVIPRGIPMLIKIPGEHPDTEAYRIMRANIEFNKPTPDAKTMTMISAGPGEGKSTTLNNLAFTCAKGGYNVLVVDADLRRPAQQTFFETDNNTGLADFLQGKATVEEITRTTKIDNLSFIPSGKLPEETVGILNAALMEKLIKQVRGQYDLVFFDSPPILGVSDGSVLASVVDMVVIVVQHRRFPRAMLQRVKGAVTQVGGATAGVVLNNVDARHDEGYSYYNAYQDYYAPKRGDRKVAPAPASRKGAAVAPVNVPHDRNGDSSEY